MSFDGTKEYFKKTESNLCMQTDVLLDVLKFVKRNRDKKMGGGNPGPPPPLKNFDFLR